MSFGSSFVLIPIDFVSSAIILRVSMWFLARKKPSDNLYLYTDTGTVDHRGTNQNRPCPIDKSDKIHLKIRNILD